MKKEAEFFLMRDSVLQCMAYHWLLYGSWSHALQYCTVPRCASKYWRVWPVIGCYMGAELMHSGTAQSHDVQVSTEECDPSLAVMQKLMPSIPVVHSPMLWEGVLQSRWCQVYVQKCSYVQACRYEQILCSARHCFSDAHVQANTYLFFVHC